MSDLAAPVALPLPPTTGGRPDPSSARRWVADHLGDLVGAGDRGAVSSIRGGQQAADAALAAFDPTGYAAHRNEVWPPHRRGASGLSPWVRHGLLSLGDLWDHVADAPGADRARFRDELLWQEYARHLYARLGTALGAPLRFEARRPHPEGSVDVVDDGDMLGVGVGIGGASAGQPADGDPACVRLVVDELAGSGWVPNQARMWLASWWVAHAGGGWRDGEDWLFSRLLDGSRAANRLGWQWVSGSATGRPWTLLRAHVERRAPGLCGTCARRHACPLEAPAAGVAGDGEELPPLPPDPRLDTQPGGEPGGAAVTGPSDVRVTPGAPAPTAVWLTAESLGDADPALVAHPDLPVVFVFDAPLLSRLGLSTARLAFLAETLADLATRREVRLWRGDPVAVVGAQPVAVTFAPVPGFVRRAGGIAPVEVHPWPWLVRPSGAALRSYSAWRRAVERAPGLPE